MLNVELRVAATYRHAMHDTASCIAYMVAVPAWSSASQLPVNGGQRVASDMFTAALGTLSDIGFNSALLRLSNDLVYRLA